MGIKIGTWNIAFRKREDDYLYNDLCRKFEIIKNGRFGWAADPFLFDFNNETYLFVEFLKYKDDKGGIAYSKYDKVKRKFTKYKTIISEDYHMSYPLVFEYKKNIYMLPETSASDTLYLYKAIDFPEKWEKLTPIITGEKLTDTTPLEINGKCLAFTYRIDGINEDNGELLLLTFENGKAQFAKQGVISKDISSARPGGKIFYDGDKLIRVSQDCVGEYGRAINFFEVTGDIEKCYTESLIRKIEPNEIVTNINRKHIGVHTYNISNDFEVIDLKYNRYSFVRVFYRILRMVKNGFSD